MTKRMVIYASKPPTKVEWPAQWASKEGFPTAIPGVDPQLLAESVERMGGPSAPKNAATQAAPDTQLQQLVQTICAAAMTAAVRAGQRLGADELDLDFALAVAGNTLVQLAKSKLVDQQVPDALVSEMMTSTLAEGVDFARLINAGVAASMKETEALS